MEGSWRGVKTHPDIREPCFISEGEYNTVKYGWLKYFALYVPPNSKVIKVGRRCMRWFLIITPDGREYGFKVTIGDAAVPSCGYEVKVEEVKKIIDEEKERERVIREAKAVF